MNVLILSMIEYSIKKLLMLQSKRYCNKHITLHNTKISIEYDNKRYDKRIKSINKTFANFWVIQLKKKISLSLPSSSINPQTVLSLNSNEVLSSLFT